MPKNPPKVKLTTCLTCNNGLILASNRILKCSCGNLILIPPEKGFRIVDFACCSYLSQVGVNNDDCKCEKCGITLSIEADITIYNGVSVFKTTKMGEKEMSFASEEEDDGHSIQKKEDLEKSLSSALEEIERLKMEVSYLTEEQNENEQYCMSAKRRCEAAISELEISRRELGQKETTISLLKNKLGTVEQENAELRQNLDRYKRKYINILKEIGKSTEAHNVYNEVQLTNGQERKAPGNLRPIPEESDTFDETQRENSW